MTSRHFKTSVSVLSLIFGLFILTANAEARTYKVGMIHWIGYSPLSVADVKGLFKKEGVSVQVINFGSNQELNAALQNKRIDVGIDMMGSWVGMIMNGVPLVLLGETDWSNGGDKIIAKKTVDPTKLKGKPVGVYLNLPSVTFFLNKYLQKIGVALKDVKIIELEPEAMASNFIANKFQVIVNYDPQALRAERKGNGKVVATSASWPGVIPEGFVAHSAVLKGIPEKDLAAIFRAWAGAVVWMKNPANFPELKKILNTHTFKGEAPYSDADLKGMLASVKIHDVKSQLERNRTGLPNYLKELKAFLKANNLLKKDFDPTKILQNKVMVQTLTQLAK